MNGSNDLLSSVLWFMVTTAPLWLPFILGYFTWELFVRYNKKRFFSSQKYTLLEIRVPKEVTKTPVAMELFLNTIWQTAGETTWYDRNFLGKTRAWFSLEIVSIDGYVHFFIWGRDALRRHVESQIYAQYPGSEVSVVSDYTKEIGYDPSINAMFGLEYQLAKPDPYPIKTYVDYGLNETATKEENKVDPLSQVLEFFGQINKGEQMWLQIICRAHKKEHPDFKKRLWWNPTTWNENTDKWKDDAAAEIKKIKSANTAKYVDASGKEQDGFPNLTKGQMDVISALERSISKPGFDVGIRAIYIGDKNVFHGPSIPILVGLLKPFNSGNLNAFGAPKNTTAFDYPWQDWNSIRTNKLKREMMFAFQKRSYFYPPVIEKHMVLNSEELATIFHFPGTVVQTPTLGRLLSKKAEPPSNLPL